MSTQHPDNVTVPFFAERADLGGEDEVTEAYYAYSHLGCDEQMWDVEGKEVDAFVVKKLLTRYEDYFHANRLGDDVRLTLRVPNPTVERAEAKVLLETLESIPRSYDAARLFYGGEDIPPPIFEVILPMCASHLYVERIRRYYREHIYKRQFLPFFDGDITIGEWIGQFLPADIEVIPLFEDRDHMLAADTILSRYLDSFEGPEQRVFLARSDPAMNYGMLSAVLLNKVALARLHRLAESRGITIQPIIGVGSAPFRGNLTPRTVHRVAEEYPSAVTFTVQSAFKYDYPPAEVVEAVQSLREREVRRPAEIDEERAVDLIDRFAAEYRSHVVELAPLINSTAAHIPSRRRRKLHIGLFGYARDVEGITLPRAISFTGALYSLGVPPELFGLSALTDDDVRFLENAYPGFMFDLADAARYWDRDSDLMPAAVRAAAGRLGLDGVERDEAHIALSRNIRATIEAGGRESATAQLVAAGQIRRFLG